MKKNSAKLNEYNKVSPSGFCQMGSTEVPYYRMNGNRLWFDKKAIERVLTGKNQHNLLGQYKDAHNHGKVFDTNRKEVVDVISKTGVKNYLEKAWSVSDERRHDYYSGLKSIENPREEKVSEPLQIPIFNADINVKVNPFIKIYEKNGQVFIDYTVNGRSFDEKKHNLAAMLISAANGIMTGNKAVKLKEVA